MLHEKNFDVSNVVIDSPIRKIVEPSMDGEGEMSVRVTELYANGVPRITEHYGVQAQRIYSDHCRLRRQQHV